MLGYLIERYCDMRDALAFEYRKSTPSKDEVERLERSLAELKDELNQLIARHTPRPAASEGLPSPREASPCR